MGKKNESTWIIFNNTKPANRVKQIVTLFWIKITSLDVYTVLCDWFEEKYVLILLKKTTIFWNNWGKGKTSSHWVIWQVSLETLVLPHRPSPDIITSRGSKRCLLRKQLSPMTPTLKRQGGDPTNELSRWDYHSLNSSIGDPTFGGAKHLTVLRSWIHNVVDGANIGPQNRKGL